MIDQVLADVDRPRARLGRFNKIGGLLADHGRRRVGMSADDRWHDRGISDPKALYPAHPKMVIDHSQPASRLLRA